MCCVMNHYGLWISYRNAIIDNVGKKLEIDCMKVKYVFVLMIVNIVKMYDEN
jgi:hypothetical protein